MRCFHALATLAFLSACANLPPDKQASLQQVLMVACDVDGVLVPIAHPVVAALGPAGATASGVDSMLVHPAVVAACRLAGGVPSSVDTVPAAGNHAPVPQP
jgi:hypothetical protein